MVKKLEQIKELISPLENRIKFAESDNTLKAIGYQALGSVESLVRGAIVGYTIGALASGFNERYSIGGALIGSLIDGAHDAIRKLNWLSMRLNDKPSFENHIKKYKQILKINYGKYAA